MLYFTSLELGVLGAVVESSIYNRFSKKFVLVDLFVDVLTDCYSHKKFLALCLRGLELIKDFDMSIFSFHYFERVVDS